MKHRQSTEFEKFDSALKAVLSLPHKELQRKLKEEKENKKRKKAKSSSASGREADDRA